MGLIKDNFYRGEYAQVLEKTYEDRKKIDPVNYSYIIGSLIFLGRLEEAISFYLIHKTEITETQKSYSYFFLAIGLTRQSQYTKAKKFLLLNRALSKKINHADPEIKFLVEQGISFFLYFLGQFEKSILWSYRALTSAMLTQDYWMKALCYDLLANNLIQTGQIYEGLKHFEQALKFANKSENKALAQAFEVSHLIFRCEYGIQLQESFEELENKLSLLQEKDSFSKANLGLEYARQLTLRGEWGLAIDQLEDISPLIYQSHNRRQEARLNLRWAEIYYLKNEASTALHYLRSGKRCLEFIDQTYEIQLLGLELKVYEKLKKIPRPEELAERLTELSQKFTTIKNNHILSRETWSQQMATDRLNSSDDEIHLLLLKANKNQVAAKKIILETNFFSWIYRFFEVEPGENYILINLEPKSITCLSSNGIFHRPQELSNLIYKILTTLSEGFTSKEKLVNSVWGYQYDPLRHDSLIYSTFSTLRKILGSESAFIETSEMGYKLNAQVLNLIDSKTTSPSPRGSSVFIEMNDEAEHQSRNLISSQKMMELHQAGLNSRQMQIMNYLEKNRFISVKIVVTLFSTSEITANRDLRALYEKQFVLRIGQGRATQYALRGFNENK